MMTEHKNLQHSREQASAPARPEQSRAGGHVAQAWESFEDTNRPFLLYDYWRLFTRHKATLVLAAMAGAVVGLLISLPQTPVYRAQASIEIQGLNEGFLGIRDINPTGSSAGYVGPDLATQVEIIESRTLVSQAAHKLDRSPGADFAAGRGRLAAWRAALGLGQATEDERWQQALAMAVQSVRALSSRESRIVRVSAESTAPELAAEFVNTLANEFIEESVEARWEATQYTEDWLERQLDDLRIKLEDAEDRLQQVAHASGLIFTGNQASVAEAQLQQVQHALSEARADRIAKQSKYELASSSPPESLPDVLDSAALGQYHVKLTQLRQELANLRSTFTNSYPEVKRLTAQIAELEKTMKRESGNIIQRIKNEYHEALRRETLLAADYDNQAKLVSEQGRKGIQYNILKREVETTRQLYENLLQKGKEARLAAAMKASPVRVVDEAVPPTQPVKPNHIKNTVLGLFAGLALGGVFILGRERVDQTIKAPGDVEFYLNTPELGVIPSVNEENSTRKLRVRIVNGKQAEKHPRDGTSDRRQITSMNLSGKAALADQERNSAELATWLDRKSFAAESFQATLTSILFSGENGDVPRRLVITSPSPGEGKTTVAANLALALAEINQKVLVIDADMRRPRLHNIFDVPNDGGLSSLLQRHDRVDAKSVAAMTKKTWVPGLYVLPSGPGANSVSNLLHSMRTRELLALAREYFDWVLIDTPPMTQLSDARLLARRADAVVLVVKAGATNREAADVATERLRRDGSRVLGVVLNHWNPKASSYSYYGQYYAYTNQSQS